MGITVRYVSAQIAKKRTAEDRWRELIILSVKQEAKRRSTKKENDAMTMTFGHLS
jgi:hypothetical protein